MNVDIWMKIVGCVLIITGASGYGISLSMRYGDRLRLLEQLRQMIFLLKGQILYANAPLDEAFEAIGSKMEGPLPALFEEVSKGIREQNSEPFYQIWKKAIADYDKETALSKEDRQSLAAMGEHLGFLDRDMQERNLLLYLEQLDLDIDYLRIHKQERSRLYTSLGVMGGMFLAILLC